MPVSHSRDDTRVYAHEPQPENSVGRKSPRHRITEQKLGAQDEPQGSLLNASDQSFEEEGSPFYARKPKSGRKVAEKTPRHRITEEKFGVPGGRRGAYKGM